MDRNNQEWIDLHEDEFVRDLTELVAIPSVSQKTDDPAQPFGEACALVLDKALALAGGYGLETKNHEYYCGTALWRGQTGEEILLMSHLDVVPTGEGWRQDPFALTRQGDMLIGRGSRDNKGPTVAALYALRCLRENGVTLRHSIRHFYGCNEEAGMEDAVYYAERYPAPKLALVIDNAFPVCHGEKGVLDVTLVSDWEPQILTDLFAGEAGNIVPATAWADLNLPAETVEKAVRTQGVAVSPKKGGCRLTATGVSAHSAFPENGDNALVKLAGALADSALLEGDEHAAMTWIARTLADHRGEALGIACSDTASGKLTCVAGMARAERGALRVKLNIRYPISMKGPELVRRIGRALAHSGLRLAESRDNPAYYLAPNHPAIAPLNRIANQALGNSHPPFVSKGGTYARKMKAPAISYGPGMPGPRSGTMAPHPFGPGRGGPHQPDEAVDIGHLKTAILIYTKALLELDALL